MDPETVRQCKQFHGTQDGKPISGSVTAPSEFPNRQTYPHHLKIRIELMDTNNDGTPTAPEWDVIWKLDDKIDEGLGGWNAAALIYRATTSGGHFLEYRVRSRLEASHALEQLMISSRWSSRLDDDPSWQEAKQIWAMVGLPEQ